MDSKRNQITTKVNYKDALKTYVGSNPSDKYLNTKIPKYLNKSILDASEKKGVSP